MWLEIRSYKTKLKRKWLTHGHYVKYKIKFHIKKSNKKPYSNTHIICKDINKLNTNQF